MKTLGEVYLHVSNSGATLKVVDDGHGPEIHIETSAFGNLNQTTKIKTTQAALGALEQLFNMAKQQTFSPHYVNPANLREESTGGVAGALNVSERS